MEEKTLLTKTLERFGEKAKLDKEAKKIVANKRVLARILQSTMPEFEGLSLEQIIQCIEDVEVSEPAGDRTETEAIIGMNTEDADPDAGLAKFDIRFYVRLPGRPRVRIMINVEIQKDVYPGYDLVTRGVFYGCRMISAQKDVEFSGDDYDSLKKVYSIWLCLEAPKTEADTVTSYFLVPKHVVGAADLTRHRYDLLNVTMIWLNDQSYRNKLTRLHGYLGTIFSSELKPQEKIRILCEEYGEKPTRKLKGGLYRMCNLGDAIEARAIKKGEEIGEKRGEKRGKKLGRILEYIDIRREDGYSESQIIEGLVRKFELTADIAKKHMAKAR